MIPALFGRAFRGLFDDPTQGEQAADRRLSRQCPSPNLTRGRTRAEVESEPEPKKRARRPSRSPRPSNSRCRCRRRSATEAAADEHALALRKREVDKQEVVKRGELLQDTLDQFGVPTTLLEPIVGPTVTRYVLELGEGVKVSKLESLRKDIAYAMASPDVRILAPIPAAAPSVSRCRTPTVGSSRSATSSRHGKPARPPTRSRWLSVATSTARTSWSTWPRCPTC